MPESVKKIKVRVIKRSGPDKRPAARLVKSAEIKSFDRPVAKPFYAANKKMIMSLGVFAVMLVIFVLWFSLLGRNLSRIKGTEGTFFKNLSNNLQDEFSLIKQDINQAQGSLNSENTNQSESSIEEDLFPKLK